MNNENKKHKVCLITGMTRDDLDQLGKSLIQKLEVDGYFKNKGFLVEIGGDVNTISVDVK